MTSSDKQDLTRTEFHKALAIFAALVLILIMVVSTLSHYFSISYTDTVKADLETADSEIAKEVEKVRNKLSQVEARPIQLMPIPQPSLRPHEFKLQYRQATLDSLITAPAVGDMNAGDNLIIEYSGISADADGNLWIGKDTEGIAVASWTAQSTQYKKCVIVSRSVEGYTVAVPLGQWETSASKPSRYAHVGGDDYVPIIGVTLLNSDLEGALVGYGIERRPDKRSDSE